MPDRIPPASPQYNGGHERMHRDMRKELQSSPARDIKQEQIRFDEWRATFNNERAHEALGMLTPAQCYQPSALAYDRAEPEFQYPDCFETRMVCSFGKFHWNGKKIFLTKALRGERIGIQQTETNSLRVWYANRCLGESDKNFLRPLKS